MYDESYLAHHGVKGMKWGVRRYINEDGSLTEAGKKRYSGKRGLGRYLYDSDAGGRKTEARTKPLGQAAIVGIGSAYLTKAKVGAAIKRQEAKGNLNIKTVRAAELYTIAAPIIKAGAVYALYNRNLRRSSISSFNANANRKDPPKYIKDAKEFLRSQGCEV